MNRYLFYLTLQALVIVFVIVIFKMAPSKEQAGYLTGSLFVGLPFLILCLETKRKTMYASFYSSLVFLAFAALPIFILRVVNPGVEFSTLSLFSVPAEGLHRLGNVLFVLMVFGVFLDWWRRRYP